jgi:hypothetical protein
MAVKRDGTLKQLEEFDRFGKLAIPLDQAKARVENGEKLIYEASEFKDSGPDYTALWLGDRRIGYWEGY